MRSGATAEPAEFRVSSPGRFMLKMHQLTTFAHGGQRRHAATRSGIRSGFDLQPLGAVGAAFVEDD